jgi:hypothetical protein
LKKSFSSRLACCELCDAEITEAEMAMVYWRSEDYHNEIHVPLLAHKHCMSTRPLVDECYRCSIELSTYLVFLLQNVGLSAKAFARGLRAASSVKH